MNHVIDGLLRTAFHSYRANVNLDLQIPGGGQRSGNLLCPVSAVAKYSGLRLLRRG